MNPPWDPELSILQHEQMNRLSPWLQRTGWVDHLGSFPLQPLGESATTVKISTSNSASWAGTCAKLRASFTTVWAAAEKSVNSESMNCSLTLLKTCKRQAYTNQDIAPFKVHETTATSERYFSLWESYLLFCCRWYKEGFSDVPIDDPDKMIVAPYLVRVQKEDHKVSMRITKYNKRLPSHNF